MGRLCWSAKYAPRARRTRRAPSLRGARTVRTLSEPGDEEGRRVAAGMEPGEVRFAARRLLLGASDGAVEILSLKPDGKQEMDAKAFAAGIQGIKTGSTWEGLHG